MDKAMLIWVTRTAPYNYLTAHHLRALGHRVVAVPALAVRPHRAVRVPASADAIVFTSAHGVGNHRFHPMNAEVPVFTVGGRTAARAIALGYRNVESADGDVRDLVALICRRTSPEQKIAHICAREPAGDLTGDLVARGYDAVRLVAYQTDEADDDEIGPAAAMLGEMDAIMIHSARAGERIARCLRARSPHWSGRAFCISEAAAAPLVGLPRIATEVASAPDEQSLIDLVRMQGSPGPLEAAAQVQAIGGKIVPFVPRMRPGPPEDPPPPAAA